MKWSWRIGRVAGIDVYLHATFFLLLAWVAASYYLVRRDVGDAVSGLIFIGALFGVVVLHELGHALAARHYGIPTRDITLLPIGGVARLERMPDKPAQELVVALAGPAVNIVIAAGLLLGFALNPARIRWDQVFEVGGSFVVQMFGVNVILAVFNLIPAFPMDGGRVLRALMALWMDYVRATRLAARIGQGFALMLGFLGLFVNPMLVFVAIFVWFGAAAEANMVEVRSTLGGIPIHRVMITDYRTLLPGDPLSRAVDLVMAGFQQDFPVVEGGQVVGMLLRSDLMAALAKGGPGTPVEDVMVRELHTASPGELAENVFARLQGCRCRSVPVLDQGRLVGILTAENVGEFLMIQAALRGQRPVYRGPPPLPPSRAS